MSVDSTQNVVHYALYACWKEVKFFFELPVVSEKI